MERAIRIGKDFNVRWSINKRVDGERQSYELAGKELVLQYRTPYGLKEATEWKTEGNIIVWTFRGKEQKALGSYELILTENGGKDGMVTVDTCRAFKLVAHSCEETEGSGSDIVIEDVVLESEVTFAALRGPQGEQGPAGPQGPQGERGPEGPQGPAGPSYNDTEIKAKLAELSEEMASNGVLIEDLQNTKIDREADDYYPKLAVGLADNLAGVDMVDSQINFRRSGGGAITDGVARIETIKGNSVVWNQVFKANESVSIGFMQLDGDTMVITSKAANGVDWGVISSKTQYVIGHKYRIAYEVISGDLAQGRNYFQIGGVVTIQPNTDEIVTSSNLEGAQTVALRVTPESVGARFKIKITDLTKMFGSGNEPTTIEEFYQRIPMGVDLNAYNEGEVIHMDVQSIESQGVNAWDEEWELGRISTSNGSLIASETDIRSKNFIPVMPNVEYQFFGASSYYIVYYDESFGFVDYWTISGSRKLVVPDNVRYVKLSRTATTYNHDICINISDTSINGKYYPYIKRVEDLSIIRKYFPQGMRSAGSAHDEIRYNKASGKWEKVVKIGEVDLGTLNYTYQPPLEGTYPHGYYQTVVEGKATGNSNMLCSRYSVNVDWTSVGIRGSESSSNFYVKDSAYTSAASFKAAMQGVILYYELAEPIVTELDEADQFRDLDYAVWNAGTEKAIAEGKSAPLAADITYGFNAIGKIKELESLVAALRAKVGI